MADQDPTVVADGTTGVEPGIDTETTPGVAAPEAEPQPFYAYDSPDGKSWKFDADTDLAKYLRQGTMRHDDFTKKSDRLTQDRDTLSQREKALEAGAQTLLQRRSEYDSQHSELERVLQAMPRDAYARLKADVQGGRQAEPQLPPEIMSRLEKIEQGQADGQERQQREDQVRKVSEIHTALGGQYEDYDSDASDTLLQELYQSPDGDALHSLYDLAHWARLGKQGVAGMQAQAVNRGAVRTGKQAPVKSPKGKAKVDGEQIAHDSIDAAYEAALAEG